MTGDHSPSPKEPDGGDSRQVVGGGERGTVSQRWPGRLLREERPAEGGWNMAYDAALLDGALARGEVILRLYRWARPTLSLGYFQKARPAELPLALRELDRVRRLSGGGAILHHHEWTYSCVVPPGHPLARESVGLYEVVHGTLIAALERRGVTARLRGSALEENPFLCFLRGDPRDIVVQGKKVTGSAQRRRRGAILQHGSVLLRASEFAPEIPGLFDLQSISEAREDFAQEDFARGLLAQLSVDSPHIQPHADDLRRAAEILDSGATSVPCLDDELRGGDCLRN